MKGYISYFKKELLAGLQYRAAALAGITTQIFWGLIFIMLYKAFYAHASIESINYQELMCYVWLSQAFFALIYIRIKDDDIRESIVDGTVAYELCRPYNLYWWWFLKLLSKRYATVLLRFSPIIIMGIIIPAPYGLPLPNSLLSFALFLLTLFLGSFIVTSFNLITHFITFYTMQDKGTSSIINTFAELLSGFAIPLPLLPNLIINLGEYLPFRLIGDLPFRVYSGNINTPYAIKSIILQIIWIIILFIIGSLLMKKSLKKVSVQGG